MTPLKGLVTSRFKLYDLVELMDKLKGLDVHLAESQLKKFLETLDDTFLKTQPGEWKNSTLFSAIGELNRTVLLRDSWIALTKVREIPDDAGVEVVRARVEILLDTMLGDVRAMHFVCLDSARIDYMYQPLKEWGHIEYVIPGSPRYIQEASECYALGLWTQCVYSLMCVLEMGLRWLPNNPILPGFTGAKVGEFQWGKWLEELDKYIAFHKNPNNFNINPAPPRLTNARIKRLSSFTSQIRVIKDTYRDLVAHGLKNYDADESILVYTATKIAMTDLLNI